MACDKKSKKCPLDSNGNMPPCCKANLIETIGYTSWLLEFYEMKHWVDYGTLLGIVRDGSVIPWDSDADFGLVADHQKKLMSLEKKIKRDGFYLYKYSQNLLQICYSETNWSYCDLWLNHIEPATSHKPNPTGNLPDDYSLIDMRPIKREGKICKCYGPGTQLDHTSDFPYWFVEETEVIKLDGHKIQAPRLTEEFLEMRYGNWRVPVKKKQSYWGGNARTLRQSLEVVRKHKRALG